MILKDFITDWHKSHSARANFALIKAVSSSAEYIGQLKSFTDFFSDSTEQLLYHYINDIRSLPSCPNCNAELKFLSLSTGYHTYCSKGCKTSYEHKCGKFKEGRARGAEKFKKTHGVGAPGHDAMLRSREDTCKKRYGVSHPMKDPHVVARYMESCIKTYGETNPMKVPEVKEKVSNTNFITYGVARPLQNKEIFERMFINYKKTLKEKYGVECVFQVPEILAKAQDSSFRRSKYEDTELHFQASFEKDFLDRCKKMNILDKLSDGPFLWYIHDGKNKRYFSDFYVKERNLVVEIKSSHWYHMYKDQNDAKRDECLAQDFDYIMILDKDYSDFDRIMCSGE